jgi:glutamine amidotransferase
VTIAVVDYGVNNLRSVVRALEAGGHEATLTADPEAVRAADRVLVPGVGNFGQGTRNLSATGLGDAVREVATAGRPVMGICLGLQLLFESSEEAPDARGIGLLPGRVCRFVTTLHVPHVGWARVDLTQRGRGHPMLGPLFGGAPRFFYHVHSYHPSDLPADSVLGTGEYGTTFPTIVGLGPVIGAQFHPEKSQRAGIELLDAFARWSP